VTEAKFKKGQKVKSREEGLIGIITDCWWDESWTYELSFFTSDNYPLIDADYGGLADESEIIEI
jgi:hypothetical protein